MNCFITRTKLFCCYSTMFSGCRGRPGRLAWSWSPVSLTRIPQQSVSSIIANQMKNNKAFSGEIRGASCKTQPFFVHLWRGVPSHSGDKKYFKSKLYSTETSSPPEKRRRGLSFILKIAKIICLLTGFSVWAILVIMVFMLEDLKLKTLSGEGKAMILSEVIRSACFLGMTDAEQYFSIGSYGDQANINIGDVDKIKVEITEKINAFRDLWVRLRDEDGIQHSIGSPVDICGYKFCKDREKIIPWDISKDEGNTKWVANCYIEGSHGLALLCVLFERHDTESEWVATKLHIEKIKRSGEVICNISNRSPNGLKQLPCLSDADHVI